MADRVTVIGWDGSPLTPAARAALAAATLVAGAPRHLALPEVPAAVETVRLGSVTVAAGRIAAHRGTAVVLTDGDPGFFGVVRALRDPRHGLEVEVIPAVSAVAEAFARAGMPWDDARVVVAHRRTLRRAVNVCRAHTKVAVLTAPGAGPAEIALLLGPVPRTFVICESLGTDEERVTVLTSDRVAEHRWRDPNLILVIGAPAAAPDGEHWLAGLDPAEDHRPRGWGLPAAVHADLRLDLRPDSRPDSRPDGRPGSRADGPGTAPAAGAPDPDSRLRALQLAALGPRTGDLLWDVGCDDGLTAAEAARLGAAVIAVDRDAAACTRVQAAASRLGVQLQVVHGAAPQVLRSLPEPDVIRIGGGGLRALTACVDRRPQRIVTHAMTRDEAEAAGRALAAGGYRAECALVQLMELNTDNWSESGRTVAFLLVGSRM
ncbi:precorrin-6y C5,15-methyltransferase (decarboxylating) subunit CbiE [Streptomyces aidingensis]|uniref:Precorrin-6Y C5,15-methyltransferase (Decarboxylating) n=1 Tax=Streptomyces aidingensis TaxID=910347 RepID=A0A1I1RVP4_9ACTN|nr:precorrin-6y C5,15-methyltransferase (decarboxylating) subunit CbiE [Streptomyces aidingensis]SFD38321.1 precorrin-6Y C5,15-methyltransferase (decarboxylating) [Streptomyces aidingensis]